MLTSGSHFDHIQPSSSSSSEGASHRRNFLIDQYPKDLHNKVYLLKHFESYMLERLMGKHDYVYSDTGLKHGMVFITRYLRMKHVILFRLSNDVLQVGPIPPFPPSSRFLLLSSPTPTTPFGRSS